jgi:helix-turn-helix protein
VLPGAGQTCGPGTVKDEAGVEGPAQHTGTICLCIGHEEIQPRLIPGAAGHPARFPQEEVAHVMGVRQPRVSAIERGELDVVTLSTLRAYVRALGGSLRVVADFGDREYRLT